MDENQGNASSLPPFLTKTYEMLEDPSTNSIVSWSQNDKSFIVWNPPEFSRDLLPRFFKHNNFSSFIRQLNTYGFRKIDPEKWEFANDDFIRGQPYLMKNIHRRKPVHSHSLQNVQGHNHSAMSESERQSLNGEIDMLKKEKQFLVVELERQEQEREGFESQIVRLKERLQQMEQRQKSTLDFVSEVLKKRGFALDLSPNLESNDRKRRFRRLTNLLDEVAVEENQMCVPQKRRSRETSPNSSQAEQVEQLELSLGFWENVVHEIGDSMVQSSLNFEAEESVSCAEDPDISCLQLNDDICTKSSKFDMNSEPVAPKEQPVGNPGAQVPTGVNDVFWEQFLTENPGSTDQQEIQSERKDFDGKNGKFWWNPSRSVNDLVEQMGQLTPAKRT